MVISDWVTGLPHWLLGLVSTHPLLRMSPAATPGGWHDEENFRDGREEEREYSEGF